MAVPLERRTRAATNAAPGGRPLVSIILPCFNEGAVLAENFSVIAAHLATLEEQYRFEILIVDDGSRDNTGAVAESLREAHPGVRVLRHPTNYGLGQAFKTAFAASQGDLVITLDVDLSYSPDHVNRLLEKLATTPAKLVLASPYMEGGRLTNVPWLRRTMSIWGNRFLRQFARENISTLTCMVRGYNGPFIRSLILRSNGMDIMPEVIYKAMVTGARIEQIPAHLDWTRQLAAGPRRSSSMRIVRHIGSTVLSGFIFRPFMFLVVPGLLLLLFSLYVNTWMLIHFFNAFFALPPEYAGMPSAAVAQAYAQHPHTFMVGLLSMMLSIQLVGLGVVALQAKKYFDELYYAGVTLHRHLDSSAQGAHGRGWE
jgi:glycosyltransferase involved in cell wall biosynthesis